MGSDGNSAVKIEGGGGQPFYLYTVKIENFRQILMSSLTAWSGHISIDCVSSPCTSQSGHGLDIPNVVCFIHYW